MDPKSTILLFVFICSYTVLTAQQQAQITLQDGTIKQVEIKALSNTTLFTDTGNIELVNIRQAAFDKAHNNTRAITKLSAAGVPVLVGGKPWEKPAQQPMQTIPTQERSETSPVYPQAELTLQDGTGKKVQIKATSATTLFTDAGNIEFADIKQAAFTEAGKTARIIPKLHAAGVPVLVGGQPWQQATLQAPQLTTAGSQGQGATAATSPGLDFKKFRKQRDFGKSLELLGAGAIAYASIAVWAGEKVDSSISALGSALLTLGILIDLDAGKHLRLTPGL